MSSELEPFEGIWRFNPRLSNTCTPAPQSWVQEISAGLGQVTVREEIVRADGAEIVLRVQARFDGVDYPVEGSAAVDTIAFTRADPNAIFGIGKKNGAVSLTQTVLADPDLHTLTLAYNYLLHERIVAQGVAVFDQSQAEVVSCPAPAFRERMHPAPSRAMRGSLIASGLLPRYLSLSSLARVILG